jgi:ribosomal protein S18 acetylase RimI-like enzyme
LDLHDRVYIGAHSRIYAEAAALEASDAEWGEALGNVDFKMVLKGMKAGEEDVRLLVCVDLSCGTVVGYVLCELRSRGLKKKNKQLWYELVNIVVDEGYRGRGAGRHLFEAARADVKKSAPAHANDLRLFVAEKNEGPLGWYRRIGFKESGWQSETVGRAKVQFLRMIRREL